MADGVDVDAIGGSVSAGPGATDGHGAFFIHGGSRAATDGEGCVDALSVRIASSAVAVTGVFRKLGEDRGGRLSKGGDACLPREIHAAASVAPIRPRSPRRYVLRHGEITGRIRRGADNGLLVWD